MEKHKEHDFSPLLLTDTIHFYCIHQAAKQHSFVSRIFDLSSFQQRNYTVAKGTMIFISCLKRGLQTEANLEREKL